MISKDKDIEDWILELISKKRIVRRKELIDILISKKFAIASIVRHLGKLEKKLKEIKSLKYPAYNRYNIHENDRKAVFYVLSSDADEAKYYDAVIKALKSGDAVKRDNALIAIESFQDIKLLPSQLTELSDAVAIEDEKTSYNIIRILNNHFDEGIFPSDFERFQNNLIACFEKNRFNKSPDTQNARCYILNILGFLMNPIILKFLEKDIESYPNKEWMVNQYGSWYLSDFFHKNKAVLFELTHKFPKEESIFIFRIRSLSEQNARSSWKENNRQLREKLAKVKK